MGTPGYIGYYRENEMMRIQKWWSKAKFYLVVFAIASVVSVAAARYNGNMTIWGALLLALGATAGPIMAAELMIMLVKRGRR